MCPTSLNISFGRQTKKKQTIEEVKYYSSRFLGNPIEWRQLNSRLQQCDLFIFSVESRNL